MTQNPYDHLVYLSKGKLNINNMPEYYENLAKASFSMDHDQQKWANGKDFFF